jgi:DNA-binding LacI/PurR family transcriptional regulator
VFYSPPLTTVRQDFPAVGRRSIDLLLEQIVHRDTEPGEAVLPPELVVRQSSLRSGSRRPETSR